MRHSDFVPRQLIKCVFGLRGAGVDTVIKVIGDDSTLMDMDAPESLPAGSTRRIEPLRDHPDHRDYFVVRETTFWREPLPNGRSA